MNAALTPLSPRCEVRRQIGAGDMRVVFEAYDRECESRVAIETLDRLDEAVRAMHLRGRVHRDRKPANILVTGEGAASDTAGAGSRSRLTTDAYERWGAHAKVALRVVRSMGDESK